MGERVMDLSVLIAARNEAFLKNTIEDVLAHAHAKTEIICVLDGSWPLESIPDHPRVTLIHHAQSIGQRAAVNEAARVSQARYVLKLDAHCSVEDGFDVKLIQADEEIGRPDLTQIPAQKNLHVYNQKCRACGVETYQCPPLDVCAKCGGAIEQVLVWKPRGGTTTTAWRFTPEPKFAYWNEFRKRPEAQADIHDVMTSLGACFFMRRERFWQIGGLEESIGSWGSFGIEIALKSWLSGGRHVVNRRTWFAHWFRVGGLHFPYPMSGDAQELARERSRSLWFENAWSGQVLPLSWVLEKFWPILDWTDADLETHRAAGEAFARRRQAA